MNGSRSASAQAMVDAVAQRSGLEPETAGAATTLVVAFAVTHLTAHHVKILRSCIRELDELAEEGRVRADDITAGRLETDRATLAGRFLSTVGGFVGGRDGGVVAATTTLVGQLGRLGLDGGDMRKLGEAMVAETRLRTGPAYVDTMLARVRAKIPVLGSYLG